MVGCLSSRRPASLVENECKRAVAGAQAGSILVAIKWLGCFNVPCE